MKVLGSYSFSAIYDTIANPIDESYEYFFILQDRILDIYTIEEGTNKVSLFVKIKLDNKEEYKRIVSFKNYNYIWFFTLNEKNELKEIKISNKRKEIIHISHLNDLIDDIILKTLVLHNTVHLFTYQENNNILYKRQILYEPYSPVYHITEKTSFAILPDLNEFKFDKFNLIVNSKLIKFI